MKWVQDVHDFHAKNRIPQNQHFPDMTEISEDDQPSFETLRQLAESMFQWYEATGNLVYLRMHLMLEEVYETCLAMINGEKVETLDGLIDLIYVTIGTALTFGLPIELGWIEVQRSNMTKETTHIRCRDKGANYSPPDLEKLF